MHRRISFLTILMLLITACVPAAPSQLVVEEHLLTAAPDLSTDQLVFHFAEGDQKALLAKTAAYRDLHAQAMAYNRQVLAHFGYSLKDQPQPPSAGYFSIYHGDQLIAKDVIYMGPLSVNASRTEFFGLAELSDGTYMFTPTDFSPQSFASARQPYAYVGDQVLSVELSNSLGAASEIRAYLNDQSVYDTRYNNVAPYAPFDGPWTYGDHWALVLLDAKPNAEEGPIPYDRLIVDGQDVNAVKGYEQSFNFAVQDSRPFYFYQKSGKIGISFDGQEIAKGYDEVPHYQCCTGALLNPGHSLNAVWFFARRGTAWYYVEAYVPTTP